MDMEIPELVSRLQQKISTRTEDYQRLEKEKTSVQAELVILLHGLEEIVRKLQPLLSESKAVSLALAEGKIKGKDKND